MSQKLGRLIGLMDRMRPNFWDGNALRRLGFAGSVPNFGWGFCFSRHAANVFLACFPSGVASSSSAHLDACPMPDGPRCGARVMRMKPRSSSSAKYYVAVLELTLIALAASRWLRWISP